MSSSLEQAITASIDHYLATLEADERAENLHALIMSECERLLIQQALEHNHYNQSHAAQWLGITRNTLKKKMIEYGLYEAPVQLLQTSGKSRRR